MNQEIIELIISAICAMIAIIILAIIWWITSKHERELKKQENEFKQKFIEICLENKTKINIAENEINKLKYNINVLNEKNKN